MRVPDKGARGPGGRRIPRPGRVGFACLMAVGVLGLAPAAVGATAEEERLKTAHFDIVLIVSSDRYQLLELIETSKLKERKKKLMEGYEMILKFWKGGLEAFRNDPENAGKKYDEPPPKPPVLRIVQKRIRGKKLADYVFKKLDKKFQAKLERKRAKEEGEGGNRFYRGREEREDMPEGNQVKNGGFEKARPGSKLADSWLPEQWGGRGKRYSVRRDKTNPHEGKYAIMLRAASEGAKPGAYTNLTLVPGKWELRYWACSDVAQTAVVQASLAGKELRERRVSEEWQQFKHTVIIEKKRSKAKLRLWTTTTGVRVYFDDVEVEAIE